ncbi:MAG: radical SAM protein [Candidatus Latescibacteria bacterium]|nr:radical SAM protein [Candidatus Latescibacterota bacterium]NIO56193.1 radical SAM protein [Candidatus Latescibacterota bacterium]
MTKVDCKLVAQGFKPGSCAVEVNGKRSVACVATLRKHEGSLQRLISAVHLSRPENYLSIYQSGCNLSCRKCHSWYFSQEAKGQWQSPEQILEQAIAYDKQVTLHEPRERATAWHASESCRCCGSCIVNDKRSDSCPGVTPPESVVLSPQGFGPARNIVAFTGGDLTCLPEFYGECTRLIKDRTKLWVLIETNGYGLTSRNLDYLQESGVDAFWLDIKAFDPRTHKWLTGCTNESILHLPEEMVKRGFVLEVLSLYIPNLVEGDELVNIARLIEKVDRTIPFTVLAFFPEYRMRDYQTPTIEKMVEAYKRIKSLGLENVRLGNIGVFVRTEEDRQYLSSQLGDEAY